ncbi:hypothetical protein E1A91_A02G007900v1 [Gossypium mustelinum]|uniref:Uncharacterized protein n=1 Tax=Gossypium mustelinum TaxID=34275 RepID=A0A5D3A447_GOSMU|nr:hypothetical protein E1A91_A02G007900v1 [Gossypium mustelinum]
MLDGVIVGRLGRSMEKRLEGSMSLLRKRCRDKKLIWS